MTNIALAFVWMYVFLSEKKKKLRYLTLARLPDPNPNVIFIRANPKICYVFSTCFDIESVPFTNSIECCNKH